jgi:hypothetical protein
VVESTLAPLSAIANSLFIPLWSLLVIPLDPTIDSRTTSLTNWTAP